MSRVSLISSSAELRMRLRPLTGDTSFSQQDVFKGDPPEVLIMDCRADVESKLAMVAALVETYPATGVLLVSDAAGRVGAGGAAGRGAGDPVPGGVDGRVRRGGGGDHRGHPEPGPAVLARYRTRRLRCAGPGDQRHVAEGRRGQDHGVDQHRSGAGSARARARR